MQLQSLNKSSIYQYVCVRITLTTVFPFATTRVISTWQTFFWQKKRHQEQKHFDSQRHKDTSYLNYPIEQVPEIPGFLVTFKYFRLVFSRFFCYFQSFKYFFGLVGCIQIRFEHFYLHPNRNRWNHIQTITEPRTK